MNGNYRITIGATSAGTPVVGARNCDSLGVVVRDKIWPSQMFHRAAVVMEDGTVEIMTPTEAAKTGRDWSRFPAACGGRH